jgi:DNA-binding GntR family transcriptional regulator
LRTGAKADPKKSDAKDKASQASAGLPLRVAPTTVASMVIALEDDIVLGRLHPRERLIEEELLERFGTTRHLIRQALAELDRMGLIERIPNRGALVRSYTSSEVEELYVLRDVLETGAASRIKLPLPADDLAELKELQVVHDEMVAQADLTGIFRANLAFHRKLFSCCDNSFLVDAIEAAAQRAHGIRFFVLTGPQEREKSRLEHHAMIAAIENNDGASLVKLCRDHLPASKNAYLHTFHQV